ncbi:MAG: hypothetical protein DRP11_01370 [Candidatus Aenigmatarchaeota archaeon]|nr:MAG: hypothetical protein DRP11_01370 [Candidatus Aenigmarchaeota archaeon]
MGFEAVVQNLESAGFFSYILPWLLTLAIVFGVLEHYEMPKSKSARAVISLVAAFTVLPLGGLIAPFLTGLVRGFIAIAAGILVAIIFVEMLGYKVSDTKNIFQEHPTEFGIVMILIAILVFIGAGGMKLLGWEFKVGENTLAMLFFLAVISLGVWWITAESKE